MGLSNTSLHHETNAKGFFLSFKGFYLSPVMREPILYELFLFGRINVGKILGGILVRRVPKIRAGPGLLG